MWVIERGSGAGNLAHHAPEVLSGTIRKGPARACFFPCTFVTNGILMEHGQNIKTNVFR